MKKKTNRFFIISVIAIFLICVSVFVWMTATMQRRTNQSISTINGIYMSEMSDQIQERFRVVIDLRLQQIGGIIKETPPESVSYGDEMLEELRLSADIRNFIYLGLCGPDGELQVLMGEEVDILEEDVLANLAENGELLTRAVQEDGRKLLILGKEAGYPMADGQTSIALVVGLPMEYVDEILFQNSNSTRAYYYIIDSDGTFVIRNEEEYNDNYFERIRMKYAETDGKVPEDYVRRLQAAMEAGTKYGVRAIVDGEPQNVYYAPLYDNSSWYLVSSMSAGVLLESISKLDTMRYFIMFGAAALVMVAMSVVFVLYYRLSHQQLKEIARTREEAIRANNAKSDFLSSMSHDIRTPMNAIIGMTEIALKNTSDAARVDDCLWKIKLSSKHLLGLINDVLDMSKIESGKMTLNIAPMSLRDTMDDIVNIIQPQVKAKNQDFDIFIHDVVQETIYCDSVRLNQVLLNILSNAVKYTPDRGRIDAYMYQEPSPLGEDHVRTHFVIKDTGIGMSPQFQQKIFDTFTREETEQVAHITGTGLGMAITKSIVDLMGGTIELNSETGKGSEFHVILDMKKAEAGAEEMKLPGWRALVVDDNEQLCAGAVASLEELGVSAEYTQDGAQAVKMVEERHNSKEDYDFVLVDWKMPGMDGLQTIHEIRKRAGSELPIFLTSAYDWSDVEDEVNAASISGFISKPLFKSTLYERLKQYVLGYEEPEQSEQMADFAGRNILLAEDIDINWEVAYEILSAAGLNLERAVNGQECVEKFTNSEIGQYDAILMDIRMPVMNGYEATEAIRALERPDRNLPIIAMTADAFSDDARHCRECGMNAHIPKPIDVKECLRVLQEYCD